MTLDQALSRGATLLLLTDYATATDADERGRLENEIVRGNMRFCAYHARRYQQPGLELEDLVAVAAAALLDAVRGFDAKKSTHFAAYARRCIRRDLIVLVRRQGSPIRLPREARRGEMVNGRVTTEAPDGISLDAAHGTGGQRSPWGKLTKGERGSGAGGVGQPLVGFELESENPEDGLLGGIDGERLGRFVDELPDREATVVRMRFGIGGIAAHELAEIGAVIGVSKQRVGKILEKALTTIRARLIPERAAA